jgi:hypothetical protein
LRKRLRLRGGIKAIQSDLKSDSIRNSKRTTKMRMKRMKRKNYSKLSQQGRIYIDEYQSKKSKSMKRSITKIAQFLDSKLFHSQYLPNINQNSISECGTRRKKSE